MATTDPWTRVSTTRPHPLPSSADRTPTRTSRLLLRPLAASDLEGLYLLTTQHEVMRWTAAGRVHASREETKKKLAEFLPPNDTKTFNCAICLRETGELVGIGGVHRLSSEDEGLNGVELEGEYGWPELGYMFKQEFWGQGLATEFVTAFLSIWEQLPRESLQLEVNRKSLEEQAVEQVEMVVREELVAIVDASNEASQRILQKCGFGQFDTFTEKHREDRNKCVELLSFRYFPGML